MIMLIRPLFSIIFVLLPEQAIATEIQTLPATNSCTALEGVSCVFRCKRSLGEQCLIAQMNFEGRTKSSSIPIWSAKFLPCKNVNIDLQITSLVLELETDQPETGSGVISATATSGEGSAGLRGGIFEALKPGQIESRHPRISFANHLDSGNQHIEISMKLEQCGDKSGNDHCRISGTLIATTDPNIRCDFHDTNSPGAYRPASLQTTRALTNRPQSAGQVGPGN